MSRRQVNGSESQGNLNNYNELSSQWSQSEPPTAPRDSYPLGRVAELSVVGRLETLTGKYTADSQCSACNSTPWVKPITAPAALLGHRANSEDESERGGVPTCSVRRYSSSEKLIQGEERG